MRPFKSGDGGMSWPPTFCNAQVIFGKYSVLIYQWPPPISNLHQSPSSTFCLEVLVLSPLPQFKLALNEIVIILFTIRYPARESFCQRINLSSNKFWKPC